MKKTVCLLYASASMAYYLWLGVHNHFQLSVLSFWLLLSLLLLWIAFWDRLPGKDRIPRPVIFAAKLCLGAGLALFLSVETLVLWGMGQAAPEEPELDYVIVLGAGLNGERPSHTLELRLEHALSYLQEHPRTKVLVTGGLNASASVTEAQAMENWLLEKGVEPRRILTEDRSTTTAENMQFGFPILLEDADGTGNKDVLFVGIATSDFHVFRSLCLASRAVRDTAAPGMDVCLYGMAADFPAASLSHYMVREFFTTCVDTLRGNMALPLPRK